MRMNAMDREAWPAKRMGMALAAVIGVLLLWHVYWNRDRFVPNPHLISYVWLPAAVLGVAAWPVFLLQKRWIASMSSYHRSLLRLFFPVLMAVLIIGITNFSLAPLATRFIGDRTFENATVTGVFSKEKGRGCKHWVTLANSPLRHQSTLCLAEEVWRQIKVGDRLEMELRKSELGVQIESVRRLPQP